MEDNSFNIRLKHFVEESGLNSSQFADRCDIPRPSFSQILNGRNKKVSNIILDKIHKAFPRLSMMWLVFGEGSMYTGPDGDNHDGERSDGAEGLTVAGNDARIRRERNSNAPDEFENAILWGSGDEATGISDRAVNEDDGTSARPKKYPEYEDDISDFMAGKTNNSEYRKENGGIFPSGRGQTIANERFEASLLSKFNEMLEAKNRKEPRKVVRITVFYDDSTFETFEPSGK